MPETNDAPQFQTAEFQEQPSRDACCICHQPISGSYYRISGAIACPSCSQQILERKPKDSHAAFLRAILFGLGGALLGLILYAAVGILLKLEIGFVSLAVGYLVGKAMMMGSGNIGGRRYQWAAVLLTYAAVSLSSIPVLIAHFAQQRAHTAQVQQNNPDASHPGASAQPERSRPSAGKRPFSAVRGLAFLALFGLASPFLGLLGNPVRGAIGIIILLVGVQIAWRITAGPPLPTVQGPY